MKQVYQVLEWLEEVKRKTGFKFVWLKVYEDGSGGVFGRNQELEETRIFSFEHLEYLENPPITMEGDEFLRCVLHTVITDGYKMSKDEIVRAIKQAVKVAYEHDTE